MPLIRKTALVLGSSALLAAAGAPAALAQSGTTDYPSDTGTRPAGHHGHRGHHRGHPGRQHGACDGDGQGSSGSSGADYPTN